MRFQKIVRDAAGILLVEREKALIELRLHRKRGFIPQQNMQKRHARHVAPQHNGANGQGNGQHQPGTSPEHGPEDRGNQQRERGDAGVRAIQPRLNNIGSDQIENPEQQNHQQRRSPSLKDRESQYERKRRCRQRAHVRDNAKKSRHYAPEQRVRNSDQEDTDSETQAVAGVDQELHREVTADALRRVIERERHGVQRGDAREPQKSVAQIFLLDQNKNGKDHHHAGGSERLEHRTQQLPEILQPVRRRRNDL